MRGQNWKEFLALEELEDDFESLKKVIWQLFYFDILIKAGDGAEFANTNKVISWKHPKLEGMTYVLSDETSLHLGKLSGKPKTFWPWFGIDKARSETKK